MAVAVRSFSAANDSASSISVAKPTGTVNGDVLVAFSVNDTDGSGTTVSAPGGWTTHSTNSSNLPGRIFYKVASGEGSSYSFTSSAGSDAAIKIVCLTGVDTTNPIQVAAAWGGGTAGNNATLTAPTRTATGAGALLCLFGTNNDATVSFDPPSGMTEIADSPSGGWAASAVDFMVVGAGATGSKTSTLHVGGSSQPWSAASIVINAAATDVPITANDSGTGTDSATVLAPKAAADSGTGSDSASIAIPRLAEDSGVGTDSAFAGIPIPADDTSSGSETVSTTAALAATDPRTGTDTAGVLSHLGTADTGSGTDAALIGIPVHDSGTGLPETVSLVGHLGVPETAHGADGAVVETLYGDLNISLWAIDPDTGDTIPLPDYASLTLSPVRNSAGSITVDYPADGLNFALLRETITTDRDLEIEIWNLGSPLGALRGYLQEASGDDVTEDRLWTFAGGFLELRMSEAIVFPQPMGPLVPDDDDDPENDQHANEKQELVFAAATPGDIALFILGQAQDRGTLTDITTGFTATHDSAGTAWPNVLDTKFSPGAGYDQILGRLVDFGLAEWAVTWTGTDKQLDLWVPEGRGEDRTLGLRPVVLRRGRNLLDAPRKWSVREAGTAVLAAGAEGFYESAADADALARRGRRIEAYVSANNLANSDAVEAYAQAQLLAITPGLLEVTHGLGFLPGEPRPLIAFDVGDWVYSQTATTLERLRVVQWTLTVDNKQNPSGTVTLNDSTTDALVRMQQRLNALTGGDTIVGTSSSGVDNGIPEAPTGVVVSSVAFTIGADVLASVLVGWIPPALNTDGTAASDLAGYVVEYAVGTGPYQPGVTVSSGSATEGQFSAPPGVTIHVRVAAFDRSANQSAWSTVVDHTTADDVTPPPVTSPPVVANYLGVLTIAWDGLTSAGADMRVAAPDFDHVDVHVSPSAGFTPDATTYFDRLSAAGSSVYVDGTYGVTYYAKFVAIDVSGNASAGSTAGSATPEKLVNIDIGPDAIDRAQIIDGEIVNAKIALLAVQDGNIANLNVGKLTTGIMTATVTLSGEFRTANTGQRMRMGSDGIEGFLSDGVTKFFDLDVSTQTVTVVGTYQSGFLGERINIRPDGTLRIYGTSGTDYGEIANDGGVWQATSRPHSSGRRSMVRFDPTGLQVWYGTPGGAVRSGLDCGQTYAVLRGPVTGIRVMRNITPDDGTRNRFHFVTSTNADASGDLGASVIHYEARTSDNSGALYRPNECGLLWASGAIGVIGGSAGSGNGPIVASAFSPPSSGLVKTTPTPARFGDGDLTGLDVIDRVEAPSWAYLFDEKRQRHFGPIAEDLQAVDPHLVSIDYDDRLVVDLRDLIGVNWSATRELSAKVRDLERRLAQLEPPEPTVVEGQVGEP